MALPTLLKSYQISANNIVPLQSEDTFYPAAMFALKQVLIGFASNPWIVVASSDAVTADATDRWLTVANVNWGTGAHSWIVLQRVDGAQILFDPDFSGTNNPEDMRIRFSPGGLFTGFTSTTVVPTATDEDDMMTGAPTGWWGEQTGEPVASRSVFHVWHSTDGLVTRIVNYIGGVPLTFAVIETIKGASVAHTDKIHYGWSSNSTHRMTVSLLEDFGVGRTTHSGAAYRMRCSGEGFSGSNLQETAAVGGTVDEITGELLLAEVNYVVVDVGARGVRGGAFDMWFGPYQFASDGDTFPNDPLDRQLVQCGHVVLPWTGDGTLCQTV